MHHNIMHGALMLYIAVDAECCHAVFVVLQQLLMHCCYSQGNWIEKLPDHLMKVYGIPKKYFLVKK